MEGINIRVLVIQSIIAILLLLTIIKLIKIRKSMKYINRVGSYGINSISENELSFFDKIYKTFMIVVKTISKCLKKSKLMTLNAKRFEKYISYDNLQSIEGIDYVSIKLLIAIAFSIFYIINYIIQYHQINYWLLAIVFAFGYFIYEVYLLIVYYNYRHQIENDLFKAVIIMNNAFQSGRNISQAINTVTEQLDGPIENEFKKINLDLSYGLGVSEAFNRFYNRVNLIDAKYIASSLSLLDKMGGNITKIFSSIEKSIINRKTLRDEIKMTTSASILMARILIILPLILISTITLIDKTYFLNLFKSVLGILIVTIVISLYYLYIIIIRKIMRVDI